MLLSRVGGLHPMRLTSFCLSVRSLNNRVKLTNYGIEDNGRELLHVETRNMCRCEACFGKHSHHRSNLPFEGGNLYPDVTVTGIGRESPHYVSLEWSDGHEGLVARTAQGEYGPQPVPDIMDKYLDISMRRNRSQEFWRAATPENAKMFDYRSVVSSMEKTRDFLAHYMIHGLGFLTGIPEDKDLLDIINEDLKCGPIRKTMYGEVDMVKLKSNPLSVGYSSGSLAGHTDLNYYYQAPHVQIFYCLQSTVEGGDSFWVDTFSAISEVREERPDYFDILSTVPVFHRYTPPGTKKYVRSHHTVVRMLGEDLQRISDNPWTTDTPLAVKSLDRETRRKWWDAYLYFRKKVENPDRWIMKKLKGGEAVFTDNWRVFHGRKEFSVTAGEERAVATAYMNWNHFQSILISPDEPCFLEIDKH